MSQQTLRKFPKKLPQTPSRNMFKRRKSQSNRVILTSNVLTVNETPAIRTELCLTVAAICKIRGFTVLQIVVLCNDVETAKLLVEQGYDMIGRGSSSQLLACSSLCWLTIVLFLVTEENMVKERRTGHSQGTALEMAELLIEHSEINRETASDHARDHSAPWWKHLFVKRMYLEYSYTASKTKITTNEELPPERAPNTWPEYVQEKKKPVKLLSYFDIKCTSRSSKEVERLKATRDSLERSNLQLLQSSIRYFKSEVLPQWEGFLTRRQS